MILPVLISALLTAATPHLSREVPAAYSIEISLNDSTHVLTGTEYITYFNPTSDPLYTVSFHLYPNAFKDLTGSRSFSATSINLLSAIGCGTHIKYCSFPR